MGGPTAATDKKGGRADASRARPMPVRATARSRHRPQSGSVPMVGAGGAPAGTRRYSDALAYSTASGTA
ncbi:hypothetical protein GCM10027435_11600 [Haloparvum alkalitolerans]